MKYITHITSSLILGKPFGNRDCYSDALQLRDSDEILPAFIDRFTVMQNLEIQGIQYMTRESHSTLGSHLWESMPDVKILAEDRNHTPLYDVEMSTGWSFGSKEKTGMLCGGLCDYYLNTTVFESPFCLEQAKAYWMGIFLPLQLELKAQYDAFPNPGNVASAVDDSSGQGRIGLLSICGVAFDISMVADTVMEVKRRTALNHQSSAWSIEGGDPIPRKRFPR